MAIENVRKLFAEFGIEGRIKEFSVSSATVELAAEALGCQPERIAKTLSFKSPDGCILIVATGDARIDNSKFKSVFGFKAKMPSIDEVEKLCGHAVGGVCPFAVKDGVKVYLDTSLCRFETVFPACGSSNSAIKMTFDELWKYSSCEDIVDVCKDWN